MAAKLTTEPDPVSTSRPSVSAELEALVMRCLEKNPADRWQSAEDLFPYLQALGTPSAELSPLSPTPRRGIRLLFALVGASAVVAVIIVLGLGLTGDQPLSITTANLVRVTDDPGLEFQPALSPDGREVAYVTGPLSKPRISIRGTVTVDGGEVRVTEGGGDFHLYPAWGPDGESLWFAACEKLNWSPNPCSWRQVGRLGGTIGTLALPRPLDRYAWSRDGSRGAFASRDSLFTFRVDGGEPHLLAVHEGATAPNSLAWSPNGRWIAYVEGNNEWRTSGWQRNTSIWMMDANDGSLVQVSDGLNMDLSPQWLPDSRHLLFVSDRDGARGIYLVEVGPHGPVGAPQSVLSATDPHSISISHDGRKLAYAKFDQSQRIWAVPLTGSGVGSLREARRVTPGNQAVFTPSLSPDGNWLAYSTNRQGKQMDIYRVPTAGGAAEVLLDRPWDATGPEWSPDGSELLFRGPVSENGTVRLQLVSKGGGVEHLLPDFPGAAGGQEWSPDGLSFVFKGRDGVWTSSRTAVGEPWNDPVRIFDQYCLQPEWSPRGDVVLCWLSPGSDIALLSADGGLIDVLDAQVGRVTSYWNQAFSSDGSLIYFIGREADGSEGFWSLPVTGGQPRKVIAFDDPLVDVEDSFALGRDEVYFVVSEYESDIWVVDLVYEDPD
jgi:Tol biopolymer transport system component